MGFVGAAAGMVLRRQMLTRGLGMPDAMILRLVAHEFGRDLQRGAESQQHGGQNHVAALPKQRSLELISRAPRRGRERRQSLLIDVDGRRRKPRSDEVADQPGNIESDSQSVTHAPELPLSPEPCTARAHVKPYFVGQWGAPVMARASPIHAIFALADVRHEMLVADAPRDRRIALRIQAERLRIWIGFEALIPAAGKGRRVERRGIAAERLREGRRKEALGLRTSWRDCCKGEDQSGRAEALQSPRRYVFHGL